MEKEEDEPLLVALAIVLRRRRLHAGLSQEELANRSGRSRRYISLLETRKHYPNLSTLNKLSTNLDMTLTEMVTEIEEEARGLVDTHRKSV